MDHSAQLPLTAANFYQFVHWDSADSFIHFKVSAAKRSAKDEPYSSQNARSGHTAKSTRLPASLQRSAIGFAFFSSVGRASQITCFAGAVSGNFQDSDISL